MDNIPHPPSTQLLGCVKHHWGETARHYGVETNFDPGLTLDKHVLGIDHCLPEVRHESIEICVSLVHNLGEGSGSTGHQDMPEPVVEFGLSSSTLRKH